MRPRVLLLALLVLVLIVQAPQALAQAHAEKSVSCTFDNGKSMVIRYAQPEENDVPQSQAIWAPAGRPIVLLTESALGAGDETLAPGAYSLYLSTQTQQSQLVVNKRLNALRYDPTGDIVRLPLQQGSLSNAAPFSIVLGHVGPKQCNLRIYSQKTGMWAEFHQK